MRAGIWVALLAMAFAGPARADSLGQTIAAPTPNAPASPAAAAEPTPAPHDADASAPAASVPPKAGPERIEHPRIVNTGRVEHAGGPLTLFGVVGLEGEPAVMVATSVAKLGDTLACTPHPGSPSADLRFDCATPNGTDLALFALVNGAAQAVPDAPALYQAQATDARAARRGIWASLPPPPVVLDHPRVPDTATLQAGSAKYRLSGIAGEVGPFATQLADYLRSKGDRVLCQADEAGTGYTCVLDDGTDIATMALVNGAARTAPDAPDGYRVQEADAVVNRRGTWANAPEAVRQATLRADTGAPGGRVERGRTRAR